MMPLSSSTNAQQTRIIERLRAAPATTLELFEECDIFRPSARIAELRKKGFPIFTHRDKVETAKGVHQNVAHYVLLNAGQK